MFTVAELRIALVRLWAKLGRQISTLSHLVSIGTFAVRL
jgi:hypothetical protein